MQRRVSSWGRQRTRKIVQAGGDGFVVEASGLFEAEDVAEGVEEAALVGRGA